ncbi:MAG: hypothetical protein JWO82_2544, partial [Akkermansiaceae bacterium]|nr:hypothetical protein [Akkermansiaceae bacterium]
MVERRAHGRTGRVDAEKAQRE